MNLQKKKFVISVDGEGLACVVGDPTNGLSGSANYPFAVEEAVREVNAAAKALFDHGAEEVIVWDSHGMGVNIAYEKLDSRCKILLGLGHQTRFPLLDDSFGGVLLLGYHSCAGTGGAAQRCFCAKQKQG